MADFPLMSRCQINQYATKCRMYLPPIHMTINYVLRLSDLLCCAVK